MKMKKIVIVLSCIFLFGSSLLRADILLDKAPLQVGNAILLRDHTSPNSYYYIRIYLRRKRQLSVAGALIP